MCLAIPGRIVEVLPRADSQQAAVVEVAGVRRRVDLGLLEEEKPAAGDWVLIHVGFAMSKISEQDALDQMRTLALLGETEAALQEIRGYGLEGADASAGVSMGGGAGAGASSEIGATGAGAGDAQLVVRGNHGTGEKSRSPTPIRKKRDWVRDDSPVPNVKASESLETE